MKTNWQIKRLGEVGVIFNGNSINERVKKEKYLNLEDGLPFIATKDVDLRTHSINYDNGVKIPFVEKSFKIAHKNSVLICAEGGSAGKKIAFNIKDICFGNKLFAIETKKEIDPKFIYYWYLTPTFFNAFKHQMNGIIGGVSIGNFKKLQVFIPSLSEQRHIIKKLDKVFGEIEEAKENTEINLKNSKDLFETCLKNVFRKPGKDWKEKRFDQICVLQRGFDLPTRSRKKGNFPLVSSNGITDRISLWKSKSPGVVTGRSGTIGNVHFIKEDFWPLNTALYIKDFHGNNERCVYYFLRQIDLIRYSSGAGVPTLNRNNVHREIVWFPKSLFEQKSIVKKLDLLAENTKRLEEIYKQKLMDLEELKKSILNRAFEGKI